MSTFTFAATANAVTYVGATPRFVDSDDGDVEHEPGSCWPTNWQRCARRADFRLRWSSSTCTGSAPTTTRSCRCVAEYGVPVIEDAAEALRRVVPGAVGRNVGRLRDLLVQRQQDHDHVGRRSLRVARHRRRRPGAISRDAGSPTGRALRAHRRGVQLPDEQPARRDGAGPAGAAAGDVGTAPLDQRLLPEFARRATPGLSFMPIAPFGPPDGGDESGGWNGWLTCVTFDDPACATPCRRRSSRSTSRVGPCGSRCTSSRCSRTPLPVTDGTSERLFAHGLCLPSGSVLTDAQVERVASVVRSVAA